MTIHNDFLGRVAMHLRQQYGNDLSRIAIVFPNKRAALYMNQYLAEAGEGPMWAPKYFTMSELFAEWSQLRTADDILLTCELYNSYKKFQDENYNETLDRFFGWGQVLLADFNDIDKNLVNAKELFANLRDYRAYDQVDFLTEEQKEVLKRFFSDFSEDRITELKKIFMRLWQHLYDIYDDYNHRLQEMGIGYEGKIYRDVLDRFDEIDYPFEKYVFVGIHAPQKAERLLFDKMSRDGRALFYWDFDHYYLPTGKRTRQHEAGHFIAELLKAYPNQLDNEDSTLFRQLSEKKDIRFVASATSAMQAHYVAQWLTEQEKRVQAGSKSAVVLCNEQLLPMVAHSIPPEVSNLNITIGYPLALTPAASLVRLLFRIHIHRRSHGGHYVLRTVKAVLHHPYARHISSEAPTLLKELTQKHRNFPTAEELGIDEGLRLLFHDFESEGPEENENQRMSRWLLDVIKYIATHNDDDDPFYKEAIYRVYTSVNRVKGLVDQGVLDVDIITFERLIEQVIAATKIPFHGEPVVGLQVMGLLETRNLDFDHLLVLNCNEGNLPKTGNQSSFIPYLLREAFGLPTQDHAVSVYAYHFYRLLQRAKDVTLVYGNVNDNNNNSGEMSRFMQQLLVESGQEIEKIAIEPRQMSHPPHREEVEKTDDIAQLLAARKRFSPSAINTYLRCPVLFFYKYILNIKEPDAEEDEIDSRLFGSLFHDGAQYIYEYLTGIERSEDGNDVFKGVAKPVSRQQLEYVLKPESIIIERALDDAFERNFFKDRRKGQHDEYNGLQMLNRQVIAHYLRRLMVIDSETSHLAIHGMEGNVYTKIKIGEGDSERTIEVGGRIDRMDEVDGDNGRCIRIVDYKTGRSLPAISDISELFDGEHIEQHSDYVLQVMLYGCIVRNSAALNPKGLPVKPALLFIQKMDKNAPDPTVCLKIPKASGKPESVPINDVEPYREAYMKGLKGVLTEILDPSVPFRPTTVTERCDMCALSNICGSKS